MVFGFLPLVSLHRPLSHWPPTQSSSSFSHCCPDWMASKTAFEGRKRRQRKEKLAKERGKERKRPRIKRGREGEREMANRRNGPIFPELDARASAAWPLCLFISIWQQSKSFPLLILFLPFFTIHIWGKKEDEIRVGLGTQSRQAHFFLSGARTDRIWCLNGNTDGFRGHCRCRALWKGAFCCFAAVKDTTMRNNFKMVFRESWV